MMSEDKDRDEDVRIRSENEGEGVLKRVKISMGMSAHDERG